ncbi:MAG: MarR family winged helix-turn-helix transcriptional regulator [Candidatus Methanomethylophilaceae archaeon]
MDAHLELIRKVQKVGKRLISERDSDLSDIGVTSTQSSALLFIAATPRCRITDLGENMEISHQAARMLVERMVEGGFLETAVDEEDARARIVTLTPLGTEVWKRVGEKGTNAGQRALKGLSDEEMAQLSALMDKIYGNIRRR